MNEVESAEKECSTKQSPVAFNVIVELGKK